MFTIKNNVTNEIIINKSRFIGMLFKINEKEEIETILKKLKKEYKDATHICYAYIFDNIKRFNDDNEPSGTAGIPILNVLENNQLNYVLCVVIRYFGGIKLGSGGLVRAYSKCSSACLSNTEIKKLTESYEIDLIFNYENLKFIESLIGEDEIISKTFGQNIIFSIYISCEKWDRCENIIKLKNIEFKIKRTLLI